MKKIKSEFQSIKKEYESHFGLNNRKLKKVEEFNKMLIEKKKKFIAFANRLTKEEVNQLKTEINQIKKELQHMKAENQRKEQEIIKSLGNLLDIDNF